jgi:outer membrane protein TolC
MVSFGAAAMLVAAVAATATSTPTATATSTSTSTPTPTPTATATSTTDVPELSLDSALAELDRQNLGIAQARSRAEEASAIEGQVRAQLVPSLSAQGSYARNSDDARFSTPGRSVVIQPLEQLSAGAAVRVPLVVPSAWFEVRAARGGARAADASAEAVRLQLRAGLAQAAHGARAAEEVALASERAVEIAAEHARSADRRVKAGVAPPLDVLRARTEQVRRESDLARARADLDRARLALGILLGREAPVRIVVPDLVAAPAAPEPTASPAEAVERRPEMSAQRAQVEAAEDQVRASWARLLPQLSATGSAFASDVAYPTGEKEGWRATVDLTWPIFDGGLREARRRQARAQLATARAGAEAQRLAVVQEVADGARDLAVARERLRLAETQRGLASDAAESARRSFEAGVASNLDVVDANDRLYQADVGLADARARVAQAAIGLERALGR